MNEQECQKWVQYIFAAKGKFIKGEELILIADVWSDQLEGFTDEILIKAFRRSAASLNQFPLVGEVGCAAVEFEEEQARAPKQLEHWDDLKTLRYHLSLEHYELYGEGRLSEAAYSALKAGEFETKGFADADDVFTKINKYRKDITHGN
jgi:hypothetical protein